MKKFYLLSISLLVFSLTTFANPVITADNNAGKWKTNNTWDLNRKPKDGDTVIIPEGITVVLNNSQNLSSATLYVKVYGTLDIDGGRLQMDNNSVVLVFPQGKIKGHGNSSEKITIGGTTKFSGNQANLIGPKIADNASGNSFRDASSIELPVKFVGFNVALQGKNVLVEWTTAEESNSSRFEIQRSEDGLNWNTISSVAAAGNSTTLLKYSYTDRNVTAKIAYYRVRQVDLDEKFIYTSVRTIKTQSATQEIKISSALSNAVYVHFSEQVNDNVIVRLTSLSGVVAGQQVLSNPVGQVLIPAKSSLKGIYVVTVTNGRDLTVSKQVIL
jgi:hypothetical protein